MYRCLSDNRTLGVESGKIISLLRIKKKINDDRGMDHSSPVINRALNSLI